MKLVEYRLGRSGQFSSPSSDCPTRGLGRERTEDKLLVVPDRVDSDGHGKTFLIKNFFAMTIAAEESVFRKQN